MFNSGSRLNNTAQIHVLLEMVHNLSEELQKIEKSAEQNLLQNTALAATKDA